MHFEIISIAMPVNTNGERESSKYF